MDHTIVALYRFVPIADLPAEKAHFGRFLGERGISGTLLLAGEGVNGTLAGEAEAIGEAVDELDRRFAIRSGEVKYARAERRPFARLRVRIRPEIITLRAPEADPAVRAGTYVAPADWNAVLRDPDILVVDTRNRYETRVGTFEGAIDPGIDSFTEFKRFVDEELDPAATPAVAMFCTGGIRCEKASSYMLAKGFRSVFHLKGGILQYLEDVAERDSLWRGECYVFDERTAVGHGLGEGCWLRCFGCGEPLEAPDLLLPSYEEGVSCRHCIDRCDADRRAALCMRHSQRAANLSTGSTRRCG